MEISISADPKENGKKAALKAAELLREAIARKGHACFIAATGASQFEFLQSLTASPGIDWGKTTMFHLDEYAGMLMSHPASFRKYLKERLVDKVNPGKVHYVEADNLAGPEAECQRLKEIISQVEIDAAFVGIGENGHLAFNDPPADFNTGEPYIVVNLDEACRNQQLGEGWFKSLKEVPEKAISMSIKQIMRSKVIICTVPDERKARAVKDCLKGPVSNLHPASILQQHSKCFMFLDSGAASLLK